MVARTGGHNVFGVVVLRLQHPKWQVHGKKIDF